MELRPTPELALPPVSLLAIPGGSADPARAALAEARTLRRAGAPDEALAAVERALALAAAARDRELEAEANREASAIAERRGDRLLARFYADAAEALAA